MSEYAQRRYYLATVGRGWPPRWENALGILLARFMLDSSGKINDLEAFNGEQGRWVPYEENSVNPPLVAVVSKDEGQRLADDLWGLGIRQTEAQGSAGQLTAVGAHLADLRRALFDHLLPRLGLPAVKDPHP